MLETLDFDRFHRETVPSLVRANGPLAARASSGANGPLAFRLPDGRAWTYSVGAHGVLVTPGDDDAEAVAALSEAGWSDFVSEARTCYGLLYAGLVSFPRGGFDALDQWEPVLRALFDGRPPHDPDTLEGFDLARSFRPDDADEAGEFLRLAGFVHIRGVFDETEVATLRAETERLRAAARPTDGRSWWAKDSTGADVCCRLIYATLSSEVVADFVDDERFPRLAALGGAEVRPAPDRLDGVSVVVKSPSIVEGLSDLPWHRDCGLGGHPVLCPTVLIGVQLDAANAGSGQLRYLAGSHLTTGSLPAPGEESLPIVGIDADPGDVTVHFGHVLHVAPPPESAGPGRRTMYVSYFNPAVFDVVPAGRGYNDVLFTGLDDGHVQSPLSLLGAR
jgi:Phytanoyl-CoA dioxygenase (PhyH)